MADGRLEGKERIGDPEGVEPWFRKLSRHVSDLRETLLAQRQLTPGPAISPGLPPQRGVTATVEVPGMLPTPSRDWTGADADERAAFLRTTKHRLDDTLKAAFGDGTLLSGMVENQPAVRALTRLISWDARFLCHPTALQALRIAQLANNQDLLGMLAGAFSKNARYAGRRMDEQRLLSRLLMQFTFGDDHAYHDIRYRQQVRQGLVKAFADAGVPQNHNARKVLEDAHAFRQHLDRLSLTKKSKASRPEAHH